MIFPDWPAPVNVVALCTTRRDREDDIAAALSLPGLQLPVITQVHGARVVLAEHIVGECEADAVISRTAGLGCRVITADCLPLLLTSRGGSEVAAIHAGWRGLAAGVVEATVGAMHTDAPELLAWIGPAISQAHYEVGRDVFDAFVSAAGDAACAACFKPFGNKYLADLAALARLRLQRLGVAAVAGGDHCTFANPGQFHSWRRDGVAAGRQVSVICIRPPAAGSRT
jgi:YfiH family protein